MSLSYYSDDSISIEAKHYNNTLLNNSSQNQTLRFLADKLLKPQKAQKNKLKQIVTTTKVKVLTNNFIRKLKKNNIYRKPIDQCNIHDSNKEDDQSEKKIFSQIMNFLNNTQGIKLNNYFLVIWALINIIHLTSMIFMFTVNSAFPQSQKQEVFLDLQYFSLTLYFFDMILNSISQKNQFKQRAVTYSQILKNYFKNGLIVDLLSIFIFPIDWQLQVNLAPLKSVFSIIKLSNNIKKFEKFQYLFLVANERQHYYSLFKVFLTNFIIGHFLSLLLNFMTEFNKDQNWYHKIGIENQSWFIRYSWGYYWGTNIMLTVGFGDVSATNHIQALILIFIQTFSCITLAYNISNVGTLISEIKANNDQKKKKLRTFHAMCQDTDIPQDLQEKITHFIEESFQIKQSFQYDQYDNVLSSLPKAIQSQYLKQANKTLFGSLGFFSNLSKKTFLNLAQAVNRKIAHPSQIIYKKGQCADFNILANGKLTYNCKILSSNIHGLKIEEFQVQSSEKPKLLSLDFVKKKILQYDIKSVGYSIIYFLKRQQFIQILRSSDMDFEFFCSLRDKDDNTQGANELYPCTICKNSYHTKFNCDRLHYVPIKQLVYFKQLNREKKSKHQRELFERQVKQKINLFKQRKQFQKYIERLLIVYFGQTYLSECQNIRSIFEAMKNHQICKQRLRQNTKSLGQIQSNFQQQNYISPFKKESYLENREAQLVKIQKLILQSQHEYYDIFWALWLDIGHSFRYYMVDWNVDRLSDKDNLTFGMKFNLTMKSIKN